MSSRPALPTHVLTDPVAVADVLVGLPEITLLGAASRDGEIELHVMLDASRTACSTCGVLARFKGWREVVLDDLRFGDQDRSRCTGTSGDGAARTPTARMAAGPSRTTGSPTRG